MTVPDPSTKFYLAINGAAQGPHNAAMVMNLWQQGTINGTTMICPEGGAAWVPLQEMEPVLRAVAPPVAPAGYGGGVQAAGSAPRKYSPQAVPQPVVARDSDNTRTLRLSTLIAALVLFFLPWVELRCAGQRMVYQSGIQTVLNTGSFDSELTEMAQMSDGGGTAKMEDFAGGEFGNKAGHSLLAGGALFCLVIAIGFTLGPAGRGASGVLAALALGCLTAQALMGFPLESAIERDLKKEMQQNFGRSGPGAGISGEAAMQAAMGQKMMQDVFAVKFSPWFYGELGLLAAATVMALAGGGPRRH